MLIKFHNVNKEDILFDTFNLLVFKKADCNAKDENGMTILHKAILAKKTTVSLYLIESNTIALNVSRFIAHILLKLQ